MKGILSSRILWSALGVWGLYWVMLWGVPLTTMLDIAHGAAFSLCVGVVVAYLGGALDSVRQSRNLRAGHLLVLGIACSATAMVAYVSWSWFIYRANSEVDSEFLRLPLVGFILWVLATGAALHLTASETIGDRFPPRGWIKLGVWTSIGLLIAMAVTVVSSLPLVDGGTVR